MKGYEIDLVEKVVSACLGAGLLDDSAFAKAWFQSRLKKYGFRRVSRELVDKGIPKDVINTVWEQVRGDYDEETLVRQIAERRFFSREQKDTPVLKRKKRVMDYLARRGFNLSIISKVIRQL
ncbi:MAG: regulatory protein RecX [Candidatus Omnitrophica bacterium]|nr:regulatory protein RecX [Candidatus Omnitrophota bacterium]